MKCCERKQKIIKKEAKIPPSNIVRDRRNQCKACKHCEKNPDPKYARFKGLTNTSKCRKAKKLISQITMDAAFECPIGRFEKIPT